MAAIMKKAISNHTLHISGIYRLLLNFLVVFCAIVQAAMAMNCYKNNSCMCTFGDGSVLDLAPLGNKDKTPRFKDVIAPDLYSYSYNPCMGFKELNGCDGDCSVCRIKADQSDNAGTQSTAEFKTNAANQIELSYYFDNQIIPRTKRNSYFTLICDHEQIEPKFVPHGKVISTKNIGRLKITTENYKFTLTTVCACPNGCKDGLPSRSGLSVGSVLCIIFFTVAPVYIIGGVLFMKFGRKAQGKEMIPNVTFWSAQPALIKEGFAFTLRPCTGRGYGKI